MTGCYTFPGCRMTDAKGVVTEYRTPTSRVILQNTAFAEWIAWIATAGPRTRFTRLTMPSILRSRPGESIRRFPGSKRKSWPRWSSLTRPRPRRCRGSPLLCTKLTRSRQANPIIHEAQAIYRANFFPEVKLDWRTHPDFVGHKNWDGCFRCHDGKHADVGWEDVDQSERLPVMSSHSRAGQRRTTPAGECEGPRFLPHRCRVCRFSCTECHTGGVQKMRSLWKADCKRLETIFLLTRAGDKRRSEMEEQTLTTSNSKTSRRHFIDLLLGASSSRLGGYDRLPDCSLPQTSATNRRYRSNAFDAG